MKKIPFLLFAIVAAVASCTDQNMLQNPSGGDGSSGGTTQPPTKTVVAGQTCTVTCNYPYTCINGECTPPCNSQTCPGGTCVNGVCNPAPTCPPGYTAVNGICTTPGCTICNSSYSGTYSTINSYHQYPRVNIDASCLIPNEHISISCTALDVPNRFTVYDGNGNFVTTSGWVGYAQYPGQWGRSLSTSSNTYMLIFTRVTSSYQLLVETQTPPNYSYTPNTDYWSAGIACYQ
jgi:hypothetical protein